MCAQSLPADVYRSGESADGAGEGSDETGGGRLGAIVTGLEGGVVATVVMSAFRIPIARSPPPTSRFWAKYIGDGSTGDYLGRGFLLHLLYGGFAGALFGLAGNTWRDRPIDERERRCTLVGALFGLVLSAVGVTVMLRRVLDMDPESDERFVFHVSHVIYGLTLGTWFGSAVRSNPDDG